jgi:hypothetical protein
MQIKLKLVLLAVPVVEVKNEAFTVEVDVTIALPTTGEFCGDTVQTGF